MTVLEKNRLSNSAGQPIKARVAIGAAWLIGARLATKAVDFISLLVLARLLGPSGFGLVAIAMTLVSIIEAISELPVNGVLVRLTVLERFHLDTAYTLGLLRGLILAAILVMIAYPVAGIYKDAALIPLICTLGIAPMMRGLQSPRLAEYARAINFWREFTIEFVAKVTASIAAIAFALLTQSYWSIVVGIVGTPCIMVVLSYCLAPYRPRLSLKGWGYFSEFIGVTTLNQTINAVNWQCDKLLLGRFVDRLELGNFSLANDLSYIPEQALIKPILRPLMSAFSHIKDDSERLGQAYTKSALSVLLIGMPIMLGLAILAEPTVRLCLGGKWIAAIPVLQWLPLTLIPPLFTCALGPLALAVGEIRIFIRLSIWEMFVKLPAVAAGAILWGVPGVIIARFFASMATGCLSLIYIRRITGLSISTQLLGTWRVLAAAAAMAIVVLSLRHYLVDLTGLPLAFSLAFVSAAGGAAYIGVALLLWRNSGRPEGLEAALSFMLWRYWRRAAAHLR